MSLLILTGASGSGKTTVAQEFAKHHPNLADVYFFDSIGVPPPDQMVREFGSGEEWQRVKTMEWFGDLRSRMSSKPILFEGQMRLAFIHDAAKAAGITDYKAMLIDCDDKICRDRLTIERGQPDLASDEMMSWASYLREEARLRGDTIVDTSDATISKTVELVRQHF